MIIDESPEMAYQKHQVTHRLKVIRSDSTLRSAIYTLYNLTFGVNTAKYLCLMRDFCSILPLTSHVKLPNCTWICPHLSPQCWTLPIFPFHTRSLPSHNPLLILPVNLAPADDRTRRRLPPKLDGRFKQAASDRPQANASSDLLSPLYVRSGTENRVVHISSLHGCLIRSA